MKAMLHYLFAPNKEHWVSWPNLVLCRWRGHPRRHLEQSRIRTRHALQELRGRSGMNVLDLFSGVGGFTLGLEAAGMRTVAFCENNEFCRSVLEKRWPDIRVYKDVRKLTAKQLIEDGVCDMAGKLKKLTKEQAADAVELYKQGFSLGEIAPIYGVTRQSMHDLLKRRTTLRQRERYGVENHFYRYGRTDEQEMRQRAVQHVVEKAIKKGILRPKKCEECGRNGRMRDGRREVQAHHDDYTKPLKVRWLCQPCHHEHHRENPEPTQIDLICGGFP
jgi:predicted DNA-binding protein YlxM (UPF0122 family)